MAKETGTLDLKALKIGHGDASTKATNYIEATASDGIKVHNSGDSSTYVQIVSGAIDFVRSGVSAMKLWAAAAVSKIRLGDEGGKHITIDSSSGVAVKDGNDEIAGFGSTMHIGKVDTYGKYFEIDSDGNGTFLGSKLQIIESPYDPGSAICTVKPYYIAVQNKTSANHSISLYASNSDTKIGLYDEANSCWVLYADYFDQPSGTYQRIYLPGRIFLANGTEIWDNTGAVTHLLTPVNSSSKQAEFTFEPDGNIYRRTSTDSGSNWTGWQAIGAVKTTDISSATSIATSTYKSIGSISLEAGTWVIAYGGQFASNSTGVRAAFVCTSQNTAASAAWNRESLVQSAATPSGQTYLRGTCIVAPTATTTYYLTLWHNAGSAINCYGNIKAIRIG